MTDLKNLKRFKKKEFRDSYMSGRVRSSLALQMRALREHLGLNQQEYAKKIGKPQSTVSRLENTAYGGVSIQSLIDIAEILDIALVVKFAAFDEFLSQHGSILPSTMAVETYNETVFRLTNISPPQSEGVVSLTSSQKTVSQKQDTIFGVTHPNFAIAYHGAEIPLTDVGSGSGAVEFGQEIYELAHA